MLFSLEFVFWQMTNSKRGKRKQNSKIKKKSAKYHTIAGIFQ